MWRDDETTDGAAEIARAERDESEAKSGGPPRAQTRKRRRRVLESGGRRAGAARKKMKGLSEEGIVDVAERKRLHGSGYFRPPSLRVPPSPHWLPSRARYRVATGSLR